MYAPTWPEPSPWARSPAHSCSGLGKYPGDTLLWATAGEECSGNPPWVTQPPWSKDGPFHAPHLVLKGPSGEGSDAQRSGAKERKGTEVSKNKMSFVLAGVAQWVERQPANQKITCSLSGHPPGLRARFPVGGLWEATHHTSMFLSLSFSSLPLSLISK